MRACCALSSLFLVLACGGSSAVNDTVTGTVNGRSFTAQDAIFTQATGSGFSFGGPAMYIEITDYAAACAKETSHLQPANGQRLVLAIASYDQSGTPAPPTRAGSFPVKQSGPGAPGSNTAELYYDAGCFKADAHTGKSGTVIVTAIRADGSVDGTFDITLTCGGFSTCSGPDATLSGTFHATACAGLSVNSTPACG